MKTRKAISFLTAAVMAVSALPILSVSAEESTYALGDVDMDGYITGHDAAMVSRYVLDNSYTLTEEQLALADVNADGAVNQVDADWIYANKVYMLGDILKTGLDDYSGSLVSASLMALYVCAWENVNGSPNLVESGIPDGMFQIHSAAIYGWDSVTSADIVEVYDVGSEEWRKLDPTEDALLYGEILRIMKPEESDCAITQLEYHLLDVDADNKLTANDAYNMLYMYAEASVGYDVVESHFGDGKYYVE